MTSSKSPVRESSHETLDMVFRSARSAWFDRRQLLIASLNLLNELDKMTSRDLFKVLTRNGCELLRTGKGSHQVWTCGDCKVTIPNHSGDIPKGTLRAIERTLEPCLGKGWLKR